MISKTPVIPAVCWQQLAKSYLWNTQSRQTMHLGDGYRFMILQFRVII